MRLHQKNCRSERSEESSGILARPFTCEAPAGFFAALRMTRMGGLLIGLLALSLSAAEPRYDQSGVPLEQEAPKPGLAKIVILAGGPSSKAMAQEYSAECALLVDWLKQQPGVWPVMARGWPANEAVLKKARCIVYFGDGGGKQPFLDAER